MTTSSAVRRSGRTERVSLRRAEAAQGPQGGRRLPGGGMADRRDWLLLGRTRTSGRKLTAARFVGPSTFQGAPRQSQICVAHVTKANATSTQADARRIRTRVRRSWVANKGPGPGSGARATVPVLPPDRAEADPGRGYRGDPEPHGGATAGDGLYGANWEPAPFVYERGRRASAPRARPLPRCSQISIGAIRGCASG